MQPLALLFAVFVLSFVAGIGWYTGRAAVEFRSRNRWAWRSETCHRGGRSSRAKREEEDSYGLRVVSTRTHVPTDRRE